MIKVSDLIAQFRIPLDEGWGYIWGATGQLWTKEKQAAATRPMTVKYGARWIGHRVIDCSGMFYWSYKNLGYTIYHGSNTIWKKYCAAKGKLANGARTDGCPIKPGTAVFLYRASDHCRHHIGLYVGGGICIEAKGTINGVVTSRLDHWDEWGELSDVDYSEAKGENVMPILRKGSRGEAVRNLQQLLNAWYRQYKGGSGDLLDPDGVFGTKTAAAVATFQEAHGLGVDGVAGEQTMTALAAYAPSDQSGEPDDDAAGGDQAAPELPEDDDEEDDPMAPVVIPRAEAQRILTDLYDLAARLERAMAR